MVCGYTHLKFEFVRYTYLNDDVWVYPFPVFLTHDFRYTHRGSPARLCTALMLRRCGGVRRRRGGVSALARIFKRNAPQLHGGSHSCHRMSSFFTAPTAKTTLLTSHRAVHVFFALCICFLKTPDPCSLIRSRVCNRDNTASKSQQAKT